MPPGMKTIIMYDVTDFLFASIHEVIMTLLITLILVFIVVYIFLQDFRSTLIPMIAVPVALIGTFFFLWIFGFSINLLTLSALLLAIAIVVDDAIVVVEAVHAKLDQGYSSSLTADYRCHERNFRCYHINHPCDGDRVRSCVIHGWYKRYLLS